MGRGRGGVGGIGAGLSVFFYRMEVLNLLVYSLFGLRERGLGVYISWVAMVDGIYLFSGGLKFLA